VEYQGRALRHEIKYLISLEDYLILKSKLSHLMSLDDNAGLDQSYNIKSLYFDDLYSSAYRDKEDGVFRRKKYRIRIYNDSSQLIKLELKEKFDKYIGKTSRRISLDFYKKVIKNQLTHADVAGDDFLLKFYIEIRTRRLRPRIIVDYMREPFIHDKGNVRITFDHKLKTDLATKDLFSHFGSPIGVMTDQIILEVKYDDYLPSFIHNSLSIYQHQITSASKYVMCCQAERTLNWKEIYQ